MGGHGTNNYIPNQHKRILSLIPNKISQNGRILNNVNRRTHHSKILNRNAAIVIWFQQIKLGSCIDEFILC